MISLRLRNDITDVGLIVSYDSGLIYPRKELRLRKVDEFDALEATEKLFPPPKQAEHEEKNENIVVPRI